MPSLLKPISGFFFLCLLVGLILSGCGGDSDSDPTNELKRLIRDGYRGDYVIDADEWKKVLAFVRQQPASFPELAHNGTINCEAIKKFATGLSRNKPIKISALCDEAVARPAVKVFLENSQSMDGYVRGQTDFEAVLVRLLADLSNVYHRDSLHLHFIDSENIHEHRLPGGNLTSALRSFVGSLEPTGSNPWAATGGSSELNQILNLVLENTGTNDLSVLVSDCIYSIPPNKSPVDGLEFAKSNTYSAFLNPSETMATLIWQLKSQFRGNDGKGGYWTMKLEPKRYDGERPYYVWFIGSPALIRQVTDRLNTSQYKGYQNRLAFFPTGGGPSEPFAAVLSAKDKVGKFRLDGHDTSRLTLQNIEPEGGVLQFILAVDLSGVPATDSYRVNPANYSPSPGFKVARITKITPELRTSFKDSGAEDRDWKTLSESTATHLITLRAESNFPLKPVTVRLNDQLPGWVAESHSDDDSAGPDADHTFGLNYLIGGVNQAYKPSGEAPAMARFTVKLN